MARKFCYPATLLDQGLRLASCEALDVDLDRVRTPLIRDEDAAQALFGTYMQDISEEERLHDVSPVTKRAEATDADILNYALTLEHLEAVFYEEGLKNYTHQVFINAGMKDPFYDNLKQVAMDEKAHEEFLTQALTAAGANPVQRCEYSFPSTDAASFLALASVLEGVGTSAYLGAAASIMNKTYLTAAGSILTVEARHSAYLRAALGEAPAAQPFDNPLSLNEVFTVASPFIVACPEGNGQLPVKAFPSLTMASMGAVAPGQQVELVVGGGLNVSNMSNIYAAFITVTGPIWAPVTANGEGKFTVTVPHGIAGQSYVVLTRGNKQATDDNILAGPAIIEVRSVNNAGGSMSMSPTAVPTPSMSGWGAGASMTGSPSETPVFTGGASVIVKGDMVGIGGVFMALAGLLL
ncbi:ferritin-like domain-containing protein [Aspergillus heterothallicus]